MYKLSPHKIHFPLFKDLYPNKPRFGLKWLKFQARYVHSLKAIREWEEWINQHQEWQGFFATYASRMYPILHTFLDKRNNTPHKRLHIMQTDLQVAYEYFGQRCIDILASHRSIILAPLNDGLALCLNVNELNGLEGLWSISLRNQSGVRLYHITFSFLDKHTIFIASVQGPRGNEAKDIVYQLTKSMYGLRPQQLIIHTLQYFAQALEKINTLNGVMQKYQVKRRWALRRRMQMDYDVLWQEYVATPPSKQIGYWQLPLEPARKAINDIPSKKRAMYRKRYAMLDEIQANITHTVHAFHTLELNINTKEIA